MYTQPLVVLPTFAIGRGILRDFEKLAAPLGNRFSVVGGERAMKAGLPLLGTSSLTLLDNLPFGGECTDSAVSRLCAKVSANRPDFLVGMGGGKAIDTAKMVANALDLPLLSIPTLISNCAPITALSVVYREDGPFDRFEFFPGPPTLTLIDLDLAVTAPWEYLRAGMGDALAKYPESTFSARNDRLGESIDHMSLMGVTLSSTCWEPILRFGEAAIHEFQEGCPGSALEIVARSIILSAGLVSLMAHDSYNCALAHSICYGLQLIPRVEKEFLHGDLVAYGALVQLVLDGQMDQASRLRKFLQTIGTPTSLRQMGLPLHRPALEASLHAAATAPDMQHVPYPVTAEMIFAAMTLVESDTL